jgi:hypothetical protein
MHALCRALSGEYTRDYSLSVFDRTVAVRAHRFALRD